MSQPLDEDFYQQPTLHLAQNLLGKKLVHESVDGLCSGRIVEVEAYKGPEDRAAHSYGGKRTARTEVMFGTPGLVYVYKIYGLHICFNIVSGPHQKPEAILVRAVEPLEGQELMAQHRFGKNFSVLNKRSIRNLTNGPGKLTVALGIDMNDYGHDLKQPPLFLTQSEKGETLETIERGPRINIDYAGEAAGYPWRFWLKDNPFVSKS